jgi:hypothetical protein
MGLVGLDACRVVLTGFRDSIGELILASIRIGVVSIRGTYSVRFGMIAIGGRRPGTSGALLHRLIARVAEAGIECTVQKVKRLIVQNQNAKLSLTFLIGILIFKIM